MLDGGNALPVELRRVERHADGSLANATLLFRADVPCHGMKTFELSASGARLASTPCRRTGMEIENEYYSIAVSAVTGNPVSIVHKPTGTELLAGESNGLLFDGGKRP